MLDDLAGANIQGGSVLTIGVFDGVHLGHHYLLRQVRMLAKERGLASAVVTFRNHPRTVLSPGAASNYITPLEERVALLRAMGVDRVVPVTFSREVAQLTYRDFVDLLIEHLSMKVLIVGPDFAMGRGRAGTAEALAAMGKERGFIVTTLQPFLLSGEVVSSTAIRKCLATGDMLHARRLLGRPYSLSGPVVTGDKRGRTLGFPTANLGVSPDVALPLDGIYCTIASAGGRSYDSVTSIGVRPTFGELGRTVETFIMDFAGDLYGQPMKIHLLQRLRDEKRFSGADELVAQMRRDVETAREVLAARGPK